MHFARACNPRRLNKASVCKALAAQGDKRGRTDWLSVFPGPCPIHADREQQSNQRSRHGNAIARRRGEKPVKDGGMRSDTMASHAGDKPTGGPLIHLRDPFFHSGGSAVAEFERVCRCECRPPMLQTGRHGKACEVSASQVPDSCRAITGALYRWG